jgi:hypothetical protein
MYIGYERWMYSMRKIRGNLDHWKKFSENLEAKRGILLRPDRFGWNRKVVPVSVQRKKR